MFNENIQFSIEYLIAFLPNLLLTLVFVVLFYFLARLGRLTFTKGSTRTKINRGLLGLATPRIRPACL